METGEVKETVSDKEIIGVYSLVNRCMKITFSLNLSNLTGENRRVLYINFEEYSGLKNVECRLCGRFIGPCILFFAG